MPCLHIWPKRNTTPLHGCCFSSKTVYLGLNLLGCIIVVFRAAITRICNGNKFYNPHHKSWSYTFCGIRDEGDNDITEMTPCNSCSIAVIGRIHNTFSPVAKEKRKKLVKRKWALTSQIMLTCLQKAEEEAWPAGTTLKKHQCHHLGYCCST